MYHPDSVATLHQRILKDAGLEHLRFHDLRHTFATLALQNGVDIKTVSAMLGHYDAGFTLRTYTHTTRQKQDEAAQTMGETSWRRYGKSASRKQNSAPVGKPNFPAGALRFSRGVGHGVGQNFLAVSKSELFT